MDGVRAHASLALAVTPADRSVSPNAGGIAISVQSKRTAQLANYCRLTSRVVAEAFERGEAGTHTESACAGRDVEDSPHWCTPETCRRPERISQSRIFRDLASTTG